MTEPFLPYGRQEISEEDIAAVSEALRAELITQGPTIERFEAAIAEYVGARHAVAFSTGTAALHAAAFAAGLGDGDEVLAPPITFAASTNCVLYQGARPRFIDIDPRTRNLDTSLVAEAVGTRTRAVVAVSFAGLPVDLEPLAPLRNRITVIEDACHALGARRQGRPVGGPGGADLTVFSFHPVKAITTGEGGIVTTEDDTFARRLRLFRTHGITKDGLPDDAGSWCYDMRALGFNYRITDFQCALGLSQLKRLDDWIERRNTIAVAYRDRLGDEERIELPPPAPPGWRHAYHLFPVVVAGGEAVRRRVFDALRSSNIGVQVHYIPVYKLSYYRETLGYPQDECPHAEQYYAGAISLPIFPGMTVRDVDRVVLRLREALDDV